MTPKFNPYCTSLEDLLFLIRRNFIALKELERITRDALPHAHQFDFNPDILEHLEELKDRLR
jgi:hypothetical protein